MLRAWLKSCSTALAFVCTAACTTTPYLQTSSDRLAAYERPAHATAETGRIRFLFDEMSGLSTETLNRNALPWKPVTTALLLARQERLGGPLDSAALQSVFQQYGFIVPSGIGNWSGPDPEPKFTKPIGIVTGTLKSPIGQFRLEVANVSCAACHAGMTYDEAGEPQSRVWLGSPNTSINFQAFAADALTSLNSASADPERFLAAIRTVYPDVDPRELESIRSVVLPAVARRIDLFGPARAFPYHAGASGLTNGLGSLKWLLGLLPADGSSGERGVTSNPDLSGVLLRSSLLYDGVYAPKGRERFRTFSLMDVDDRRLDEFADLITIFTVPSMGVEPGRARGNRSRMKDVAAFIATLGPPPFPLAVDKGRAMHGETIYREECSSCHGRYEPGLDHVRLIEFPNRLVPVERIGSDPLRAALAVPEVGAAIARSPFATTVDAAPTGGYIATRLSGLWASAPYLHNGSVPTLWHLMHPEKRPAKFEVGGHRLDLDKVGIAGEMHEDGVMHDSPSYAPWARPSLYDTSEPGLSNKGHERPFAHLSEDQKSDLLEYLKLL